MPNPLVVSSHLKTRVVENGADLRQVLLAPDSRGGGEFWLVPIDGRHPQLAVRVSGDNSDVHYFPSEGHPGFRRLAPAQQQGSLDVSFRFEGCDPHKGEVVPAAFVLPLAEALAIATEFLETDTIGEPDRWVEL